ncbi:hypothetical protein H8959_003512 [Pygathrix nigripes]
MPEGPLVRKFHHLVSPFVGQQVVKTGGRSKKLQPAGLQSLWLQHAQVHGKKLFLRFDPDEEMEPPGRSPPPEPPQKEEHKEGAVDPKQDGEPSGQKTLDGSSQSAELNPQGEDESECLEGDAPAGDAGRWLRVSFGLFGSVWVNEFSRAKKANKRGDWRDPSPRPAAKGYCSSRILFTPKNPEDEKVIFRSSDEEAFLRTSSKPLIIRSLPFAESWISHQLEAVKCSPRSRLTPRFSDILP